MKRSIFQWNFIDFFHSPHRFDNFVESWKEKKQLPAKHTVETFLIFRMNNKFGL